MVWETIYRPGFSGKKKFKLIDQNNEQYGKGNWRIMWQWGNQVIPNIHACQIYEDAYYADSFNREDIWKELTKTASEVYDIEKQDVESGLDYLVQNGPATHLQDISIRRVVFRRGWEFEGDELVRIRGHKSYWGKNLSPGRLPFHEPQMLIKPPFEKKWWNDGSVEDWYQRAKILQAREAIEGLRLFVICSKHNYHKLPPILDELKERGHDPTPPNSYDDPFKENKLREMSEKQVRLWKQDMIRLQEVKIKENDGVLVINMEKKGQPNYLGGATFLEIFKAWELGKKVFMYNPIPDNIFRDELDAIEPTIIYEDLSKVS